MIEIRKAVSVFLKTLCSNVYYQQAPDTAIFPYIVYVIQIYPDGENMELVTMDIDGWDSNTTGDTLMIENLMAIVNGKLDINRNPTGIDKKTLVTDEILVTFFNENKTSILDDDKNIKHRLYTYSGNLMRFN